MGEAARPGGRGPHREPGCEPCAFTSKEKRTLTPVPDRARNRSDAPELAPISHEARLDDVRVVQERTYAHDVKPTFIRFDGLRGSLRGDRVVDVARSVDELEQPERYRLQRREAILAFCTSSYA